MKPEMIWCECNRKFTYSFGKGDIEIPWKCSTCKDEDDAAIDN